MLVRVEGWGVLGVVYGVGELRKQALLQPRWQQPAHEPGSGTGSPALTLAALAHDTQQSPGCERPACCCQPGAGVF